MQVNQNGYGIVENYISCSDSFESDDEVRVVVLLLAERLGIDIVRTNATKSGNFEIVLQDKDQ